MPNSGHNRPSVRFDLTGIIRPTLEGLIDLMAEVGPVLDAAIKARGWEMHRLDLDGGTHG